MELVLDDVDVRLQTEAEHLVDSVHRLEAQLVKAKNCYANLQVCNNGYYMLSCVGLF